LVEQMFTRGVGTACLVEIPFGQVDTDERSVGTLAERIGPDDGQRDLDGEAESSGGGEFVCHCFEQVEPHLMQALAFVPQPGVVPVGQQVPVGDAFVEAQGR
jgi:hypothetical protein